MKKRSLRKWCSHMVVAIGVLFLGGCNLGGFLNRAQIGFAEQAGAFAFNFVIDLVEDQAGDQGSSGSE